MWSVHARRVQLTRILSSYEEAYVSVAAVQQRVKLS